MKSITVAFVVLTLLASGGEIASYHAANAGPPAEQKSKNQDGPDSAKHGIFEIGIERGGCLGGCPEYTFIVGSDGAVRYEGFEHVARKGKFTGKVSSEDFQQLARFIRDSGYMELEDNYHGGGTDRATDFTMVLMKGKRKTISNYANSGPSKLWAIEQLIDGLMAKVEWNTPQK